MPPKAAPRRSARQSAVSSAASTPRAAASSSSSTPTSTRNRRSARARTTESASVDGGSTTTRVWVEIVNVRLPGRAERLRGALEAEDKGKNRAIDGLHIATRSPSVEIVEQTRGKGKEVERADRQSSPEASTSGVAAIQLELREDEAREADESLRTPSPPPTRPEQRVVSPTPPPRSTRESPLSPPAKSSPPVMQSPPTPLKSPSPPAANLPPVSSTTSSGVPSPPSAKPDANSNHKAMSAADGDHTRPTAIRLEERSDPESGSEADVEEVARPAAPKRASPKSQGKRKEVPPASSSSTEGEPQPRVKEKKKRDASPIKKKQKKAEKASKKGKDKDKKKSKKRARRSSDEDDLEADLNADAFARSTAPTVRKDFAASLQKFKAARQGKGVIKDSDADSSSDSDSSDDSSSSSSSEAFIVDDEPSGSKKKGKIAPTNSKKKNGSGPRPNAPPRPSILTSIAGRPRLELGEACYEYCRWLLVKIFDLNVHSNLRDQLWAAREQCQRYAEDSRRMLATSAMRRQFTWYLNHYPTIKRQGLFSSQIKDHRGCAACHRSSQACDSKLILSGKPYDRKTLMFLEPEEDRALSSDMSTDAENAVEHTKPDDETFTYTTRHPPPRKMHIFYAGSHCANRAMIYHQLAHWEYQLLQKIYKSDEVKQLLEARDSTPSRPVTADDIENVANQWRRKLTGELTATRSKATEMSRAR